MNDSKFKIYETEKETRFFINLEDKEYGIYLNKKDKNKQDTIIKKAILSNEQALKGFNIIPVTSEV